MTTACILFHSVLYQVRLFRNRPFSAIVQHGFDSLLHRQEKNYGLIKYRQCGYTLFLASVECSQIIKTIGFTALITNFFKKPSGSL